jgi:seryl-tRNA synthetase
VHDIRLLRENPERLVDGLKKRGVFETYADVLAEAAQLELERRTKIQLIEVSKAERNELSQQVAQLKRNKQDATAPVARSKELGDRIALDEAALGGVEDRLSAILMGIPNITLPDVPEGGEAANKVVRSWGDPRPAAGVIPHWEIGEKLGILDLAAGAKIAGSGFIVLRGAGARLTRALMAFMLDMHTKEHGYQETWVPFVVNRRAMAGTGQLPKFEDDMYRVSEDDLFLIPTAEVPVTNLARDEVWDAAALPMGLTAYTPCFRREAGAAGKDTRGLIRVHQFDKVELVRFATPETSAAQLELLTGHAEAVLERLGLPYRRLLLAAGDTGFSSAMTYDLEVWAPGVGKWLEVSSCSNFTDFQARRANIRYRPAAGEKPRFVHTLNGSALAFPRTIIALLEHHQRADGTITVPEALRPYLGADRIG